MASGTATIPKGATGKTRKARAIPLNIATPVEGLTLLQVFAEQKSYREKVLGRAVEDSDVIFTNFTGLNSTLKRNCAWAGIYDVEKDQNSKGEQVFWHALRHTAATNLCKYVQPAVAQKMLGHANINITMSYYTHIQVEDSYQAMVGMFSAGSSAGKSLNRPRGLVALWAKDSDD